MSQLIAIKNLSIYAGNTAIIENLSLSLSQGETLTVLGETGAGKSLLAQAIMGDLPSSLKARGTVSVNGIDMLSDKASANNKKLMRERMWGTSMVMLPQEPWRSLSPMMQVCHQITEVFQFNQKQDKHAASRRAQQELEQWSLGKHGQKVPSQLSGGMAQRVAFACASATQAPLFIADEPTKGLDASRKVDIISQLKQKANEGTLLTITHDIAVAKALGGRCIVLKNGKLIEENDTQRLISQPKTSYSKLLVSSSPEHWPSKNSVTSRFKPFLTVENLSIQRGAEEIFSNVNFTLGKGEIVGLSGDSGSGKTSLGDALLGLLSYKGKIRFHYPLPRHQKLKLYQDPPSAFAEHVTLQRLIDDLLKLHKIPEYDAAELASSLGLDSTIFGRSALEVSGGELQRVALLRALMLKPKLLIADEPTSRLDPITSKKITLLLVDKCREFNCSLLLISHDKAQLEKACDRVISLR